ncbi:hypothetical protein KW799_02005 [Candidatus Parcubacteria bacterium]|nr:hypothetical protein [Candidatus Parcubacteria bacterium]
MNEKLEMDMDTKVERVLDMRIESLLEEPMPSHLHAKIMKRVFLAGYGKYLAFSASILLLNLGVLGLDLYRTFTSVGVAGALKTLREGFAVSPAYFASAVSTLYGVLPLQSIVATGFTVALSAYIAVIFVRVYRNPHGVRILKGM